MIKIKKRGFSLVEILMASSIVSIGLLGVVGLQINAQQQSNNAFYHAQAAILTHDIIEKAKSNPIALYNGGYNLMEGKYNKNCYSSLACTPEQIAKNDIKEWNDLLHSQLPMGQGIICIDSTPRDGSQQNPACDNNGTAYAVKIWWHDVAANELRTSITKVKL